MHNPIACSLLYLAAIERGDAHEARVQLAHIADMASSISAKIVRDWEDAYSQYNRQAATDTQRMRTAARLGASMSVTILAQSVGEAEARRDAYGELIRVVRSCR